MIEGSKAVLCFGEMLWDSLPQGLFPGGAPMNVAYHLRRHGLNAMPVSAVGRDLLGAELLRRLRSWGVDTRLVGVLRKKATGTVEVELDKAGKPKFTIVQKVAWDEIPNQKQTLKWASRSAALVFGSLAQRSANNRLLLAMLLKAAPQAWKIFDVNLRPPFVEAKIIWGLAAKATLIKLNDEELGVLLGRKLIVAELEKAAREFSRKTSCDNICVTAGGEGAGLLLHGQWHWEPARKIKVKDTVGAGDAFLSSLIYNVIFRAQRPEYALRRASRLAEYIASRDGATPAYEISDEGDISAAARMQ